MIHVTFTFPDSDDSRTYRMVVSGHAMEEEDADANLKCASATALGYALGQSVLEDHSFGRLEKEPKVMLAAGEAEIECTPKPQFDYATYVQFETIANGFKVLACNYPKTFSLDCLP